MVYFLAMPLHLPHHRCAGNSTEAQHSSRQRTNSQANFCQKCNEISFPYLYEIATGYHRTTLIPTLPTSNQIQPHFATLSTTYIPIIPNSYHQILNTPRLYHHRHHVLYQHHLAIPIITIQFAEESGESMPACGLDIWSPGLYCILHYIVF
jgi:hypothetical protein